MCEEVCGGFREGTEEIYKIDTETRLWLCADPEVFPERRIDRGF